MTAEQDIDWLLTGYGWMREGFGAADPRRRMWFRWTGPVRQEIHCVFDRLGRLDTWSYWENRRIEIDGETGRRARLADYIERKGHLFVPPDIGTFR